jgi:hypothetical protein
MGKGVWLPTVSGPLAPYAAGRRGARVVAAVLVVLALSGSQQASLLTIRRAHGPPRSPVIIICCERTVGLDRLRVPQRAGPLVGIAAGYCFAAHPSVHVPAFGGPAAAMWARAPGGEAANEGYQQVREPGPSLRSR